jgi:hypothetical protein
VVVRTDVCYALPRVSDYERYLLLLNLTPWICCVSNRLLVCAGKYVYILVTEHGACEFANTFWVLTVIPAIEELMVNKMTMQPNRHPRAS